MSQTKEMGAGTSMSRLLLNKRDSRVFGHWSLRAIISLFNIPFHPSICVAIKRFVLRILRAHLVFSFSVVICCLLFDIDREIAVFIPECEWYVLISSNGASTGATGANTETTGANTGATGANTEATGANTGTTGANKETTGGGNDLAAFCTLRGAK